MVAEALAADVHRGARHALDERAHLESRAARPPPAPARPCRGARRCPARAPRAGTGAARGRSASRSAPRPRGAVRTQRLSGGVTPKRARRRRSASASRPAASGPSSSKRARGRARGEHELERAARGVRRDQHRLVVDGDEPLAPPDLLLHQVAEQVAAHGPHGVGAEALALARDRRGDEVQRVELRVGVRERRAALVALVDDQVHARGARVGAHPLPPCAHRGGQRRRARGRRASSPARARSRSPRGRPWPAGRRTGRARPRAAAAPPRPTRPGRGWGRRGPASRRRPPRARAAAPAACGPRGRAGTGRPRGRAAGADGRRTRRPAGPRAPRR